MLWEPDCPATDPDTPPLVSGNEATINYGNAVCNVNVYLFDRTTGCRSKNPYIHTVKLFDPGTVTLPSTVTACPGATIVFGADVVPWQNGVLYRWELQDTRQHYASVQGDATKNTVTLQLNDLPSVTSPYSFYIDLIRNWCDNCADTHRVTINVTATPPPATISVVANPSVVCPGQPVNLTASGCGSEYRWSVGGSDGIPGDASWQWSSSQGGIYTIVAACSSYDYCNVESYYVSGSAQVTVYNEPAYGGLVYDMTNGTVSLDGADMQNYTYAWTLDGVPIPGATSKSVSCQGSGHYACTVTGNHGCTETYELDVTTFCPGNCNSMTLSETGFDYCSGTLSMTASTPSPTNWMVFGGHYNVLTPVTANSMTVKLTSVGIYRIFAQNGNPVTCETGSYIKTVDFLPSFPLLVNCTDIVVNNVSKYLDGSRTVTIKLYTYPGGTYVDESTFPLSSPNCTFCPGQGSYSLYLTDYNGTPLNCYLGQADIETDGGSLLTIETANTYHQDKTCDNIPLLLTASLSGGEQITHVHWDFGDGSQIDRDNDYVYHTFEKKSPWPYLLTATATDLYGCTYTESLDIVSVDNVLINGEIKTDDPVCCPYVSSRDLYFKDGNGSVPTGDYRWVWSSGSSTSSPPFAVSFPDDYTVRVRDVNYCLFEAKKNVPFLQHPTAVIIPDQSLFCERETIFFHGAPGSDSNLYTYTWRVTTPSTPSTPVTLSQVTATVDYVPQQAGTYTIELELKNSDGCIDVATYTFLVHPKPAPPTVSYNGNRCIHTPPVVLQGSGSSAGLYHWSCGDYGNKGYYFYPARATAYYYDPATGCRSDTAGITIEPAPNMDAVLSGCYAFCDEVDTLKVWGLTPFEQTVGWKWYKNELGVQTGSGNYLLSPLLLPLSGMGSYRLNAEYDNGGCNISSHDLEIVSTDYCPCDSLKVSYTYTMNIVNCHLEYTLFVTVTNNSLRNTNCLQEIEWLDMAGDNTMTTDFTPTMLGPGRSYYFKINLIVNNLLPSHATFRITDNCRYCIKDFDFDLVPAIPCNEGMTMTSVANNPYLTSTVASYFDFNFDLAIVGISPDALLAFWCEPPMVVDYTFIPLSGYVQGLGMLDLGLLRQMAERDEKICFYAVTCRGNTLCKLHYCLSAVDLLELLEFPDPDKGKREAAGESVPGETGLHPNPTTGRVEVTGAEGRVEEVVVIDMYGRQVFRSGNTGTIDVSDLATGSYIVRIKVNGAHGTEVYYRKLIKK